MLEKLKHNIQTWWLFRSVGEHARASDEDPPVDGDQLCNPVGNGADDESAPESGLVGFFDRVDRGLLTGWALDRHAPNAPLRLGVWFKDVCVHVCVADMFRPDLAQAFGAGGRHGFEFLCPTELRDVDVLDIEMIPVGASTPLPKDEGVRRLHGFRLAEVGAPHPDQLQDPGALRQNFSKAPCKTWPAPSKAKIAVVIVNRNNGQGLERLFASFERHNSHNAIEFVVVDQASTDNSRKICAHWSARFRIAFVDRRTDFSVATSRNYGARLVGDCNLLLFMSSGIELCADTLPAMAAFMGREDCGLLGVRIRDFAEEPNGASVFVDHLGIAFDDCATGVIFRPYEVPDLRTDHDPLDGAWEVPALSGDFMMARRSEFEAIGGFDEDYHNRFEDVDLCLLARRRLGKRVFCMSGLYALRRLGIGHVAMRHDDPERGGDDLRHLESRAGARVRSQMTEDMFRQKPLLRPRPTRVAFAVTAADMSGEAGDYFTAFELGAELHRLYGWHVSYLEDGRWYDLDYFDIVVAMRHDFDPARIRKANPHLFLVGWVRNWCDLWLTNPQTRQFDQIWASSEMSAQALQSSLGRQTPVIKIATNVSRFGGGRFVPSLQSDYCFTGSYFDSPRDIVSAVDPQAVPFTFAVYGHHWEKVPEIAVHSRGPLPYDLMPDVYASTPIVIDDSNSTTLKWGSLNSRVFDALASGALVLTNNVIGSEETFGGRLPTWSSRKELTELLVRYLGDEEARRALVMELRAIVVQRHSYACRAQEAHDALFELIHVRRRVGIEIAAPSSMTHRQALRDAIAAAVDHQGFVRARREIGGLCDEEACAGDDVKIVVAAPGLGGGQIRLRDDQVNILIALGSAADIAPAEMDRFDLLFVGDDSMAAALAAPTRTPVFGLFDQPGKMARNVIRFEGNGESAALIDSRPLRLAATECIAGQAETFSSLIAAKGAMRDPRRRGWGNRAQVEAPSPRSARLVFYPDYRETNPYQQLLYDGVGAALSVGPGSIEDAAALVESGCPVVIFHLHWTSVILGVEGGKAEARKRSDDFLLALDRFLALGGRLFWTIHNRQSHETPFPEIESELYRELARRAATVHVHSRLASALLADIVRLSPEQLLVAAHGNYIGCVPDHIDRAEARARLGLDDAAATFLFFGQIRSYKGVGALLDAFDGLPQDGPVQLIVAGMPGGGARIGGLDALRARLAHMPGVSAHLKFIPDDEVQIYFRAADAVILPYRTVLTSGSAILALSFGKPVIAPMLGLIADLVHDGAEGCLYDPGESDGLQRAMQRFLQLDASARARMEAAARARAEELSWDETGKALFLEALAGAAGQAEVLGSGENARRCFVRRGPAANSQAVLAVLHEADVEMTRQCVASIVAQPGPPLSILVISTREDPMDYLELCEDFPSTTVVQAPPGTSREDAGKLALVLARQDQRRFFGLAASDLVFEPGGLAPIVASADRQPDLRVFSVRTAGEGSHEDKGAICGLVEMNLRERGLAGDRLAAAQLEAFRNERPSKVFLIGSVDQFDALFADMRVPPPAGPHV